MNAKMRIGHFTATQPLRLRVKMASLKTGLVSAMLVVAVAHSMAAGLPDYDANLERWAKQRLAERIGEMRDSYQPSEAMRMVTEVDVKRGPLPLGVKRNFDPISLMATIQFSREFNLAQHMMIADFIKHETLYPSQQGYHPAIILAGN